VVQFGGQTPLKLASALAAAGIPILGTSPDAIDLAEDRERFRTLLGELGLRQPENETCTSSAEARAIAEQLGAVIKMTSDRRIAVGAAVGKHRTSMLQDLDAGRPMEIDALITAVQELGRLVDVPTPTIDILLALVQQRGRVAGTYGGVN